jgi:hypothetical protein
VVLLTFLFLQEQRLLAKKAQKLFGIKRKVMPILLVKTIQNFRIYNLETEYLMLRKLKKYLAAQQLVDKFLLMHVAMVAHLRKLVLVAEVALAPVEKTKKTNGKMTLTGFIILWKIS